MARADQRLQRRENLLVGQIAGRAEENEGIRAFGYCHLFTLFHGRGDATPPGQRDNNLPVGYPAWRYSSAKSVRGILARHRRAMFGSDQAAPHAVCACKVEQAFCRQPPKTTRCVVAARSQALGGRVRNGDAGWQHG